jgi:prolyl 4-hydroxylase
MERMFWPAPTKLYTEKLTWTWTCKHREPYIYTIDAFLSEKELTYFDTKVVADEYAFQDSLVEGGDNDPSGGLRKELRSSSSLGFTTNQDTTITTLTLKLANLLTCQPNQVEPLQVVRYLPSQAYGPHHDMGDIDGDGRVILPGTHDGCKRRLVTVFIYLNDIEKDAGGCTHFPSSGLRITPKRGMAVVWSNINEQLRPDNRTIHEGEPVTSGIKYGLNAWIIES